MRILIQTIIMMIHSEKIFMKWYHMYLATENTLLLFAVIPYNCYC